MENFLLHQLRHWVTDVMFLRNYRVEKFQRNFFMVFHPRNVVTLEFLENGDVIVLGDLDDEFLQAILKEYLKYE